MKDDFDNIRAERDLPYNAIATAPTGQYAGLWKQIALGILVAHLSLGVIGTELWMVAAQLLVRELQIIMPWASQHQG
jgi:hypothetical protein